MNSFIYLLSNKFFTVKLQIFQTEAHKKNSSPYEYFTLITALSCKYETSLFRDWVEKQHPENFQFKAQKLQPYSFPKDNKKNDSKG